VTTATTSARRRDPEVEGRRGRDGRRPRHRPRWLRRPGPAAPASRSASACRPSSPTGSSRCSTVSASTPTGGIRIALADTEAELQRAAEGEEVEGLAKALVTNLLLGLRGRRPARRLPGRRHRRAPAGRDVPLLRITVADIDCEQDDERAFANAQLAGATVSLAGLIEAGFPEDIRDRLRRGAIDQLNEKLWRARRGICNP
jgi:hypothetical protein